LHGALWYAVGALWSNITWTQFKDLCDEARSITVVGSCLHGLGHAGVIKALSQVRKIGGCTSNRITNISLFEPSILFCDLVPPEYVVYYVACVSGAYHAFFEYFDNIAAGVSWLWPCNESQMWMRHGQLWRPMVWQCCFRWLFEIVAQGGTEDPEWVDPSAEYFGLWKQRQMAFESSGQVSICITFADEETALHCISGLSAVMYSPMGTNQNWPWRKYFAKVAAAKLNQTHPYILADMCAMLSFVGGVTPLAPISATDKVRWLTCVSGSMTMGSSFDAIYPSSRTTYTNVCKDLKHVSWLDHETQDEACEVCTNSFSTGLVWSPRPELVRRYKGWAYESLNWQIMYLTWSPNYRRKDECV